MMFVRLAQVFVVCLVLGFLVVMPSQAQAATFTVNKTADTNDGTCDADCSFREAVAAANANPGADTIEFNIPTSDPGWDTAEFPNAFKLAISTQPISINDSETTIDGSSQTQFSGDTNKGNYVPGQRLNNYDHTTNGPEIFFDFSNYTGPDNIFRIRNSDISIREIGFYNTPVSKRRPINLLGDVNPTHNFQLLNCDFVNLAEGVIIAGAQVGNDMIIKGNVIKNISHSSATSFVFDVYEARWGNGGEISGNLFHDLYSIGIGITHGSNLSIKNNIFSKIGEGGITVPAIMLQDVNDIEVNENFFVNLTGSGVLVGGNSKSIRILNNEFNNVQKLEIDLIRNSELIGGSMLYYGNGPTPNDPSDLDTGPNDLMNYPIIDKVEYRGNSQYFIRGYLDANPLEAPYSIEICVASKHPSGHGGCLGTVSTISLSQPGHFETVVNLDTGNPDALFAFTTLATNNRGSTSEFGPWVEAKLETQPINFTSPKPDFTPAQGGVIVKDNVISVVESNVFRYDSYMSVISTTQTAVFRLPNTRYFQASAIHQIWHKAAANHAKILESEVNSPFIVALKYDPFTLDKNLNPKHLRLAHRPDSQSPWKVLRNSVLDQTNQTVAVVTKQGGDYMLVSRW